MSSEKQEHYFKTDIEWREWLHLNHDNDNGIYLIFFKVENKERSMRWEEAVKVALCYGWIDSTVKSLGNGKRRQYFCKRNVKSVWSALNKRYIEELIANNLMQSSGLLIIEKGKENGSWTALDAAEKGIIPPKLQVAFNKNKNALENYNSFAPSYRKSYLFWLNQAKRETTKDKRIAEIIKLCDANIKTRNTW
ncbi:YdeI/OmpD-associated family protein [Lacinutrix jangbogonensis]|uniref:YdeI/OmpD-associated family protein n=1 Tax=Lacinutrix jangbogonensis TaxID=1469557 RepID=UPI00053EED51|nr:YdeI/OmpD-associated family protein [Lacinutrix jangbogonensis]